MRLPAYSVAMLFEVPAIVNAAPLSEPLTVVAPVTETVPPVTEVKFAVPATATTPFVIESAVKFEAKVDDPLPDNVPTFTSAVEFVKLNDPLFETVANEPADAVNALLLKVAVPLVTFRLLPPAKSVPTVKLPLFTVNAPL